MQHRNNYDAFLNSDFSGFDAHDYEPFQQGCLDVRLPAPNSDIRLFFFEPASYPYLWVKYIDGLRREYSRIGVHHILDLETLSNPNSSTLCVLAIIKRKIVSGMRFHGPLRKVDEASVYSEMSGGNQELLKQRLESWIPEKVVEGKGLWLVTKHPARKRVLQSMARSSLYGTALLGARYIPGTSPANIMKIHVEIGMQEMQEIGCVPYPNDTFKTTFGLYDLHRVFELCTQKNHILLRRDWQQIQRVRLQSEEHRNNKNTWLPIILEEANPFHAQALESLLTSSEYEQRASSASIQNELSELVPPVDEDSLNESKRWVAYPWRKVAIELVGPRSFKRLLRDRNRNKITDFEQENLAALTVGVIGLSTGHVIAHTMVMEGVCGHIKLADFDNLEISNLNRIPASLLDLGTNKAVIAARRIAELDPYIKVEIFDEGLQESNIDLFMSGLDIVIEECDSLDVKVLVREAAIKRKIPVLMSTSDLGMMDVERFDLDIDPKPFHGLTNVNAAGLKDLSRRDKSDYALAIVEGEKISARLAASMIEIDHTVSTWPQLASDVMQGAALVTTAVRRIGTGKKTPSSRARMDMGLVFENALPPVVPSKIEESNYTPPTFTGVFREDVLLAVSFAPSLGNSQPWRHQWAADKFQIEIIREATNSLDIKSRASLVALGAASLNAEIVAAYHDKNYIVEHYPEKNRPDLVTQLTNNAEGKADKNIAILYPFLLSRKTNRSISERQLLSAEMMRNLSEVSHHYPVKLHMLSTPEAMTRYSDVSSESDRLRYLSADLHKEMMQEMIWPDNKFIEKGIDVRTLGLAENELSSLSILKRPDVMNELAEWDAGASLGDYNKSRIESASAIVVITVSDNSDYDYIVGGKAMQHFWLIAEQYKLAVQPLSPIFLYADNLEDIEQLMHGEYQHEVTLLQQRFNGLLNIKQGEHPIAVLRLAVVPEPPVRSLRRL